MSESNITITFVGEEVVEEDFACIEYDNDANGGKTVFEAGDTVFLKVFYTNKYEYVSSGGTLKRTKTKVSQDVEDDYVVFAATNSGYLKYPPDGRVEHSWVGNDGGELIFNGRKVLLAESKVAVLKCSYSTLSDQLSIKFDEEGIVVVLVFIGAVKTSRTVMFDISEDEPVPYNIKVTDYCSGVDVNAVSVTITTSGVPIEGEILAGGITDDNGEVYLGMLIPGRRYELSMVRDGYLSSTVDQLNNDFFIVPN